MNKHENILDIVSENDEIIGSDSRDNIHDNGLLHREVVVWIYNDKKQIVLQKRSKGKIFFPGMWSSSVAGHVESGDSYIITAIKEAQEETGIIVKEDELIFVDKINVLETNQNKDRKSINNIFKNRYIYKFKDGIDELVTEKNEADELKWFDVDELLNLSDDRKKEFVPAIYDEATQSIFKKIKEL